MSQLDDNARAAIDIASDAAVHNGFAHFDAHHLLFGLLTLDPSFVRKILESLNVDVTTLMSDLTTMIKRAGAYSGERSLGYTAAVRTILVLAREVTKDGERVRPEHLLIAIVQDASNPASELLEKHGVSKVDGIKQQLERLTLGNKAQNSETSAPQLSSKTTLAELGAIDLTKRARAGKLDPVIGRDREIERASKILSRRRKNNVVLIGEPGVGKTAIAEGLALKIASNDVPKRLRAKIVVSLEISSLVGGTIYRGQFEERLRSVLDEVRQAGNIILFIDELHTLVGAGSSSGPLDAANMMKASLARGELQCMGATTFSEYRKYIEKDAALSRRFQPLTIAAPDAPATIEILQGIREDYERYHEVYISEQALAATVRLSDRYISGRFQPDKAIDVIDEAAAAARARADGLPEAHQALMRQIAKLTHDLKVATHNKESAKLSKLKLDLNQLSSRLERFRQITPAAPKPEQVRVEEADVERVISEWTGIPLQRLTTDENKLLLNLPARIHERLIGQEHAVDVLCQAIRRARTGLKDPRKPIGSFLFLGPTGVGKTELARTLALILFESKDALIRIDMSEYMEKYSISRLIGAPPGYVGYDQAGALTEPVRKQPYSVVLLDEIEKAHPDVWNILLQVLDDGRLTDSQGNTADFKNTIIIMTANGGIQHKPPPIGFASNVGDETQMMRDENRRTILDYVHLTFRPEWINRLDELVMFENLTLSQIVRITKLRLQEINQWLADKHLSLLVSEECERFLASEGFDQNYGARALNRTIQRHIQDPLSLELLKGRFKPKDMIRAKLTRNMVSFEVTKSNRRAA